MVDISNTGTGRNEVSFPLSSISQPWHASVTIP